MKIRHHWLAIVLGLAAGCVAVLASAGNPDLSGNWVLDRNRSFSNPAGLDQVMSIAQHENDLRMETTVTVQGRETHGVETWVPDGTEREFEPAGAPAGSKGKRRVSWMPSGRGLLIEDDTEINGPKGITKQQTTRKVTLSADKSTLTIDYYVDRPGQSYESKRIFARRPDSK